jgi:thiol-disulfide isomerase/thioredoxin
MKQTLKLLTLFAIVFSAYSSHATGIEFNHELKFEEALAKAKQEGKLVFVDCYTSWCGPCKRLAATVFVDSAVGQYFNTNYVNVKIDMEKDEGPSVATRYQITAYPTLLWLDPNGSIKNKVVGGLEASALINAGKKAAPPINDKTVEMEKIYNEGKREQAFLQDYLAAFKETGRDYNVLFGEYLKQAELQKWSKESMLPTIFNYTTDFNSPGLSALVENRKELVAKYGAKEYSKKVTLISDQGLAQAKQKTDVALLKKVTDLIKALNPTDAKQQVAKIEMDYYLSTSNATVYDKYVTDYIKKYGATDANLLNDVAWQYYINTLDDKYLKKAMLWSYKAVNLKNCCAHNTTYAYLQYKLGNYSEATKACDYAIIKAKEENITPTSALALKTAIKKEISEAAKQK